MPNAVYNSFKALTLSPGVDLVTANVKAALVTVTTGTTNYAYSAAHANFSDVPAGSILAAGVALTSKALVGSVLNAASVVWPLVPAGGGETGQAIILYIDTGTAATSSLIGYIDTAAGIPVTPTGQDITLSWSSSVLSQA